MVGIIVYPMSRTFWVFKIPIRYELCYAESAFPRRRIGKLESEPSADEGLHQDGWDGWQMLLVSPYFDGIIIHLGENKSANSGVWGRAPFKSSA